MSDSMDLHCDSSSPIFEIFIWMHSCFSSVRLLSCVRLFVTQWTAAHQASLSISNSRSLLKLMSIKSVMPSNHLILCHFHLLPSSIFPSTRVLSDESVLRIRWPNHWSFRSCWKNFSQIRIILLMFFRNYISVHYLFFLFLQVKKASVTNGWLIHSDYMRRVDSLKKTLMLGGIGAGGEGDDRGWDGWMASLTRQTWVWVNSRGWWWTGRPGVLWFMGSQRVGHDWATEDQ